MTNKNRIICFESSVDDCLPSDAVDGMALMLAEDEAEGFEGVNVWDISIEDPPHAFLKNNPLPSS